MLRLRSSATPPMWWQGTKFDPGWSDWRPGLVTRTPSSGPLLDPQCPVSVPRCPLRFLCFPVLGSAPPRSHLPSRLPDSSRGHRSLRSQEDPAWAILGIFASSRVIPEGQDLTPWRACAAWWQATCGRLWLSLQHLRPHRPWLELVGRVDRRAVGQMDRWVVHIQYDMSQKPLEGDA